MWFISNLIATKATFYFILNNKIFLNSILNISASNLIINDNNLGFLIAKESLYVIYNLCLLDNSNLVTDIMVKNLNIIELIINLFQG